MWPFKKTRGLGACGREQACGVERPCEMKEACLIVRPCVILDADFLKAKGVGCVCSGASLWIISDVWNCINFLLNSYYNNHLKIVSTCSVLYQFLIEHLLQNHSKTVWGAPGQCFINFSLNACYKTIQTVW